MYSSQITTLIWMCARSENLCSISLWSIPSNCITCVPSCVKSGYSMLCNHLMTSSLNERGSNLYTFQYLLDRMCNFTEAPGASWDIHVSRCGSQIFCLVWLNATWIVNLPAGTHPMNTYLGCNTVILQCSTQPHWMPMLYNDLEHLKSRNSNINAAVFYLGSLLPDLLTRQ